MRPAALSHKPFAFLGLFSILFVFAVLSSHSATITSAGGGNYDSTIPGSPWPGGSVPGPDDTVIIDTGHSITGIVDITVASMTVRGTLGLSGLLNPVTLTVKDGGKLINLGSVQVTNDSEKVSIEGEAGGGIIYEGNDIDYNNNTIYLGRVNYSTHAVLASGDGITLSQDCTFYKITTAAGSTFNQGDDLNLFVNNDMVLASGTFLKDPDSNPGKLYLLGDFSLNSGNQNLGKVEIGSSPDTITLTSDLTVDDLTINSGDILQTNGYEVTVSSNIIVNGQLDVRAIYSSPETDNSLITLGNHWTSGVSADHVMAGSTVAFNTVTISSITGGATFYSLRAMATGTTLYFTAGSTASVTNMVDFQNISLLSTTSGATWYFSYTGSSQTLTYLRVRDSNAASFGGLTMNANDGTSTDLGNNTNWIFDATAPSAITTLAAPVRVGPSMSLTWTAPGDDGVSGNLNPGTFRIFYSSVAGNMTGLTATTSTTTTLSRLDISTSGVTPGSTRYYSLSGLVAGATVYARIFTGDEVPNWSAISNAATGYPILDFDRTQIEVESLNGGLDHGHVAWGDFDNDGDLDILASGSDSGGPQLRVYKNNGNGTIDPSPLR